MWEWLLERYARFVLRRPWATVAIAAVLSVAAIAVIPRLTIVTSRTQLVSEDNPLQARILKFLREFGWHHNLVAIVQGPSAERSRAFADRVADALRHESDVVRKIFYKIDLDGFRDKALLYVPVEELRTLRQVLEGPGPLRIEEFVKVRGLLQLLEAMDVSLARSLAGGAPALDPTAMKGSASALRILSAFFDELTRWIEDPGRNRLEVLERLYLQRFARERSSFDPEGYLAGKDGRTIFLFIHPVKEDDSAENQIPFTERVRSVIARERKAFGEDIDVGVTGLPANIADEMTTVERDMAVVSLAAFSGIALLFLIAYRFSIRIVLALVPIMVGTLWTFGFAGAAVGHLSLLSSVFGAVLFGLGDDFGIHLLARFEEEWERTGDPHVAVEKAVRETGPGVVTGALTTAVAFYTTILVEIDAFRELGLIAGTGLLLVALAAFLLLPPLFLAWAWLRTHSKRRPRFARLTLLGQPGRIFGRVVHGRILRYPVVVLGFGGLATAFFLYRSPGIRFDYDILKLLPEGSESVRYYYRLIETSNFSTEFNAIVARSLAEVKAKTEKLEGLKTVGRVESVMPLIPPGVDPKVLERQPSSRREALEAFLPPNQEEKLGIFRTLEPIFRDLPQRYAQPPPVRAADLARVLERLADDFERVLEAAPRELARPAAEVLGAVSRARRALRAAGRDGERRANDFQRELLARLQGGLVFFRRALRATKPITPEELTRSTGGLIDRLVGKTGQYAIYAFPSGPIWNRDFLSAFIRETHEVDREVTGFPVNFYYFSERIQEGFQWASLYAAIAIFFLLLLEFRNLVYAVLAAVPLFVGATWMLGLMNLLGLEYNLANIVALPLILGMGVEYGVEIVHRFAESAGRRLDANLLSTTARAITIAGLTTMIGLGSMGLASHKGLASLGLILVCGIGGCLLTSILILPSILKLVARAQAASRADEKA